MTIFGCKAFTPTQAAMWKMIHASKQAHLHVASVATLISVTGLRKTNLRGRGVNMNLLYVISEFCFLLLVMYQVNLSIFLPLLQICYNFRYDRFIFVMTFLKCFENEINIIIWIISYLLIHTCSSIPLLPKLTEGQFSSEEKKQPELISQIGCKSERFLLHTVHVGENR